MQAPEVLQPLWYSHERECLARDRGRSLCPWFEFFGKLLLPPWQLSRRVRRPPTDPVNALLSLGYTLLLQRTLAACEAVGLDAALGSLHEYHPGRPSLACDLMEPLRVPAVDRWVIALCNQHRIARKISPPRDGVSASARTFSRKYLPTGRPRGIK